MTELLYRPDVDAVRQRLTTWWNGGDIGRPVMLLWYPRTTPLEDIPAVPAQSEFLPPYDWRFPGHRVNWSWQAASCSHWMGEIVPFVAPNLGPGCLALYLGCKGIPAKGTTWIEPFITTPDATRFDFNPDNPYWQATLQLTHSMKQTARGRFGLHFPDLLDGLDTLAAMRGSEALLYDLIERPEWVHHALAHITDLHFRYYDRLYDMIHDEIGGSIYWIWAPGRLLKTQCDFSAMISPEHFGEFMVPVLKEETARVSYTLYHWDGPQALVHKKHILGLERINVVQYEPGAGAAPASHRTWWPLYHDILNAGKQVYISCKSLNSLHELKGEFGKDLNRFLLVCGMASKEEAEEAMSIVSE